MALRFRPRLLDRAAYGDRFSVWGDVGAGITVGVVALPLAMAFAIASGLKPEQGLVAAVVGGFLISALGGSSVQIGGPAGAFIVVVAGIVAQHGVHGLLVATAMAGMLMVGMGLAGWGSWVRRIPGSLIAGFTNGIAVLIMLSQVKDLLGLTIRPWPKDFVPQMQALWAHLPQTSMAAAGLGLVTFIGMLAWTHLWQDRSLLPRAVVEGRTGRTVSRVPGAIVALVSTAAVVAAWGLPVDTLGTRFGSIPSVLPAPQWPGLELILTASLWVPALTLAVLGAIESLLCARVADGLSDSPPHDPDQELMAQGLANIAVPFFGGMPVTGTVARTVTNVRSGGRTPVAGMVHAATLMLIMLAAAPWCLYVPMPALAGVLLYVAWNMGEWRDFQRVLRHRPMDRMLMLCTFVLTVVTDLTVALGVGLLLAAVQHAVDRRRPTMPG